MKKIMIVTLFLFLASLCFAQTLRIGDRGPGGGIIFAVEGNTFMEAHSLPNDMRQLDAIRAALDFRGGGFSDWYLPSKSELNLVFENLQRSGLADFGPRHFWANDTEMANNACFNGFLQNFANGNVASDHRYYSYSVIIVRRGTR